MNIRDFEYLVALAEHKHFRKAAESCFVSQPTLSGQIKKLEDEVGLALLERTSRKVLFTEAGLQLVEQAKKILLEVKRFSELANQQGKEMTGPLHLGFIPTVGPYVLPWIVPTLKAQFPDLNLYLHEAQTHQLVKMLEEGKIDCMILASVEETNMFIEVPVYDEPMVLAVPKDHKWATEVSIDMSRLSGESVLMLGDGHCLRDQALGFCFAAGAKDDDHFKATSLETLRNMVAAGGGITLMPYLSVPKEKERDGVCYLPAQDPVPHRQIVLAYRPGSPLRARYESLAKEIENKMSNVIRG
ncbi:DNA-binding transcriptional regulator OxyR [Aliivibrio fischeri]|uniref:DNA-binding transcriptional regulator OxyR n=1 Tax=Aliivibrio fischeri SR5 TaxID=1088719 RepID=A0AAV3ERJ0_ALIFS|nr:DNA-binding transcriptional regulator OxyR [Aliivibrio fischeri]EHN69396.1 DNA-binding transcriptional regulator OxyR [Aliivibrio fischeri SR5]MBP3142915.1 DNA-binding transcriptional regulator OxyR [Aliivibrio fischeri]MBP3156463.1 DNA-binding transcriptional regulator OxyR [Aliivibrio fischeri]MCE7573934.1 DNA-binding transcriptional regulator OxyR [Aliivibrio fischeri]MCE7578345.1 DNA-binding transcriptional regulator OxyR [Aliivibrio fischeri]